MLDAHSLTVGLDLARLALLVQRAHLHPLGALHAVVDAGHRQAALVALHALVAGPQQLGVDQHQALVALFRDVDDDQALVHVDLRGRQAGALGVVHGVEHVVDERAQAVVHGGDGRGHLVQARIGVAENGEQGHGSEDSRCGYFRYFSCSRAVGWGRFRCRIKGLNAECPVLCQVSSRSQQNNEANSFPGATRALVAPLSLLAAALMAAAVGHAIRRQPPRDAHATRHRAAGGRARRAAVGAGAQRP